MSDIAMERIAKIRNLVAEHGTLEDWSRFKLIEDAATAWLRGEVYQEAPEPKQYKISYGVPGNLTEEVITATHIDEADDIAYQMAIESVEWHAEPAE